ncbi:MAG: N-acetyltransferase family protein [Alphaproteobacteria bacterium]|nr:N-acetyltransferase family protein [Alphaproteobacteria bacterium]
MSPIAIRPATEDDADSILAIYTPIVEQTAISFEDLPPTLEEMKCRILDYSATHAFVVAERKGMLLGYAYGSRHRERSAYRTSADVTAYVAESTRRAGVGRAMYVELLAQLKRKGFHAAFGGIALPNQASIALHESVGFTPVGVYREVGFKLGRWHDVGWWQRILT